MQITLPLILDAATGTELQKNGFTGDGSAEQWVIDHPEVLQKIQREYVEDGSNVILASTFGANRPKLEAHGIKDKVWEYNHRLVEISRQAADGKAWVAGDIAPTGYMIFPYGSTPFEDVYEIFKEQAEALEDAGVDLFVLETMMSLAEMRAAVLAVKAVSRKPILATFTFEPNGRTLTGTDAEAALLVLQGMGVDAFGLNCSTGPDQMMPTLERLSKISRIPLIAKPNAGKPIPQPDGSVAYDLSAEGFGEYLADFAAKGVQIYGGCCGSTRDFIKVIKSQLEELTPAAPSPENLDKLPAATEKQAFFLAPDAPHGFVLKCDDMLDESFEEDDENPAPLTAVEIKSADQIPYLAEYQPLLNKPLCILCDDAEILEQALRVYNGRAVYEGSLSDTELKPLADKYGLLI